MKVKEIMTREVISVTQDYTLFECAKKMNQWDIGVLPICEEEDRIIGVVTDRDLVIRGMAEGLDSMKLPVKEIMSWPVVYCFEEDDAETAIRLLELNQVRRIFILNRKKRLAGVLSLTDFATRSEKWKLSEEALQKIAGDELR